MLKKTLDENLIIELWNKNFSAKTIHKETRFPYKSIVQFLKNKGIYEKRKPNVIKQRKEFDVDVAYAIYQENKSVNKTCRMFGVSRPLMTRRFREHGYSVDVSPQKIAFDKTDIVKQWNEGKSALEIHKQTSIPYQQIVDCLSNHGIKCCIREKIQDFNIAKEIYEKRKSIKDVADHFGLTVRTIQNKFRENGIEYIKSSKKILFNDEDIINFWNQNLTSREIQQKTRVPLKQILDCLKRNRIYVGQKIIVENVDDIIQKYEKGKSIEEIAREKNVSRPVIKRIMTEHGFKNFRSPSQRTKNAVPKIRETTLERHGVPYGLLLCDKGTRSKEEIEIENILKNYGLNVEHFSSNNLYKGISLDGLILDKKVAFEYGGLFWHSEMNSFLDDPKRQKEYHKIKFDACVKRGIRLFTFFDYEWKTRGKQILNMILSACGVFPKIPARKCIVSKISNDHAYIFCQKYHIQGMTKRPKIAYGIYHDDELLGVVTYDYHHRKGHGWTLNRLCFKEGIQIVGGASKLIKKSLKEFSKGTKIDSWSDNRFSLGNVYEKMGFKLEENLSIDYFYTNAKVIKSKGSMKKSVTGCPKHIKEADWNRDLGWYRVWDCGKKRWTLIV